MTRTLQYNYNQTGLSQIITTEGLRTLGLGELNMRLTKEEQQLIAKYLKFYRALASGQRHPTTRRQRHFVDVTQGHAAAETAHEFAYLKWRRAQRREDCEQRDPESEGPTPEWFTREDWKKQRQRQRFDGR